MRGLQEGNGGIAPVHMFQKGETGQQNAPPVSDVE